MGMMVKEIQSTNSVLSAGKVIIGERVIYFFEHVPHQLSSANIWAFVEIFNFYYLFKKFINSYQICSIDSV